MSFNLSALDAVEDWPALRSAARTTAEALGWEGIVRDFAKELQIVMDDSSSGILPLPVGLC